MGPGWGRKYACLVLPTVLMPRGDFCPLGQVVWGLVGAKVRLPRPTSCANAPWWIFSLFLLCEKEFSTMNSRLVEAGNFLTNQAGGLGAGLGRKYAYLVLPTVLMPRGAPLQARGQYIKGKDVFQEAAGRFQSVVGKCGDACRAVQGSRCNSLIASMSSTRLGGTQ